MSEKTSRRNVLASLLIGGAGLTAFSNEEKILSREMEGETATETDATNDTKVDGISGASRIHTNWGKLADLKEKIPMAKMGDVKLSRIILGGNLISGFAHARDLLYVSDLVLAYHTREKVIATFKLAEACGINTFLMNPRLCDVIKDYWEKHDGTLQFMTNCSGKTREEVLKNLQKSIDYEAVSCVIQGEVTDRLVREKDFDTIRAGIDLVRENGLPVGLAAHRIETFKACVNEGIRPDYWMKTFHHLKYWSARATTEEHDNVFCRDPEETKAFMNDQPEPWIAFKILGAGAIKPEDGFRFALESGADFLCVGMYDFQIVDDVNICVNILKSPLNRTRPWQS
ncbi:MAG: hypothetical protein ACRCUY_12650 [Thermoguttaceae bacterium]